MSSWFKVDFSKFSFFFKINISVLLLKAFISEFLLNWELINWLIKYWVSNITFTKFCLYLEKIK